MIPEPDRAARSLVGELSAIAVIEVAGLAALIALGGIATGARMALALALAAAVAIVRAAAAGAIVRGQRVLHRAATARGEERFAPPARLVDLAWRVPHAIAWAPAPILLLALLAISPAVAASAAAVATLAVPAVESRVRATLDRWLAEIPDEDLPERRWTLEVLGRVALALAPALAISLASLAIAPPGGAALALLALVPGILLAAGAWREAAATRRELAVAADRIARIEPGDPGLASSALVTEPARRAEREALAIVRAAADTVRHDADARIAIEREEQVRARFMAAMGHELRSPLNSIVGFAQLLEDGTDGPLADAQKESVVLVRRSAEDLLLLLTDILDSARLDANRLRLRKAWTPSVEIVTEAVTAGRKIVSDRIAVEARIQPGLPPVNVDRARIVQAVSATFRHAVRSTSSKRIEVRASVGHDPTRRRSLLVEVRDPERTLGRDELERIFDAFRDLRDASTGRRIGGLGLALSLARKLVRLHGGEVWAESSSEHGTRYIVALPLGE